MKQCIASVWLLGVLLAVALSVWAVPPDGKDPLSISQESPAYYYTQLQEHIVGDWQDRGKFFTNLHKNKRFQALFLTTICLIPAVFLLHFIIVGAKEFAHDGEQIFYFGLFSRIIHWIGAVFFSLLVVTGLLVVFGGLFGGGELVRVGRYVHIGSAMVFSCAAFFMFLVWVKDMLPKMSYDIRWIFMLGGYLSKEKKPVPAGKFNAGQKIWFWLATAGGGVMAYTGYIMWGVGEDIDTVRLYNIIHNCLAAAMIAFFITHLYMSLFAIKGSLASMKTGYKPKEEVDIMHSRYKYK